MPKINCFYRVRFIEVIPNSMTKTSYKYFSEQAEAEEKIKFFLKKNDDIAARLGHVPMPYIAVDPNWDIVDHIPDGD